MSHSQTNPDDSKSTESRTVTEIDPVCPTCGSDLHLRHGEIVVSGENGARVPVRCSDGSCEWSGTANYRMVSLTPDRT
jgi:hypothetical protein